MYIRYDGHNVDGFTGQKAVDDVKSRTTGGNITLLEMDNTDLASVKKAADEFLEQSKTLNILVTNAG
jgi:NAD(P)-dependent dehydrogenase (short-subunit alcohol dehydrogenase family)